MGMTSTTVKFDTDTKTILKRMADSLENIERCLCDYKYMSEDKEILLEMEFKRKVRDEIASKSGRDAIDKVISDTLKFNKVLDNRTEIELELDELREQRNKQVQ